MPAKISTHIFKGMQKDINVANSSNDYLFDAHNIRFNQLDDDTLMSITNERGNELITFANNSAIYGQYVSSYVVDNCIIIFTHVRDQIEPVGPGDDPMPAIDHIYRISYLDSDHPTLTRLFQGDLNISPQYPLEFTSYYESESVVKIYWVDGQNQLKFMNIYEDYTGEIDANCFNTTPRLQLNEEVTVEQIEGSGQFPAGVIQYAFTYINKLGAESNIFYVTKLHSIQFPTRTASPQEQINCVFRIVINNIDTSFDYVRCYQLIRVSQDAQPTCIVLDEVPITSETITIYDNNTGAVYDPTELLFQKYPIKPYTLDQKNNTLFLGNLNEDVFQLTDSEIQTIRDYFNQSAEYTEEEAIAIENNRGAGTYELLRFGNANINAYQCEENNGYVYNSDADIIRTFKSREAYRIGVQLQNNFGNWSEPVYLKDIEVNCRQVQQDNIITPISLIFDGKKAGVLSLGDTFKRFRFLMVNPTAGDRNIPVQGIVIPTIYELSDRLNNAPFAYASWYLRPFKSGITSNANQLIHFGSADKAELQAGILSGLTPDWYTTTPTYNNGGAGSVSDTDQFPNLPIHIKGNIAFTRIEPMWVQFQVTFYITKENCSLNYTPVTSQYVDRLPISANESTKLLDTAGINTVYNGITNVFSGAGDFYSYVLTNDDHDRPYHGESRTKENNYIYESLYNFIVGQNIMLPAYGSMPNVYVFDFTGHNGIDVTDFMIPTTTAQNNLSIGAGTLCDFRIDHSILNLYSPDLDNNYHIIHNNKLELDLIGFTPINNVLDNVFIELTNSPADPHGHLNLQTNYHRFNNPAFSPALTRFLLLDTAVTQTTEDNGDIKTSYGQFRSGNAYSDSPAYQGYATYPWHRATSLNNDIESDTTYVVSAKYAQKIFAKHWISHMTQYFSKPYKYKSTAQTGETVSGCECNVLKVCNDTTSMVLFRQNDKTRMYMPNVDIARTFVDHEYAIKINVPNDFDSLSTRTGTFIVDSDYELITTSDDPIQIKYKCDTHVLIPIDYSISTQYDGQNYYYNCHQLYNLPILSASVPSATTEDPLYYYPLWDNRTIYKRSYKQIMENGSPVVCDTDYLFMGELYRDTSLTRYGGPIVFTGGVYDRNNPVLIDNVFIPITESYKISDLNQTVVTTTYGDTWFGRWDCLKTQHKTDQDQQSIHDYASVMVESHINLNGRYDSYRNFYDQTLVNANNSNKFNNVYNQMDTFWSYKIIPNYTGDYYYPNQVTWSLTKQADSLVDTWTRVVATNIEQLDGTKGDVQRILNYRDALFVFQDRCISQIKYNEQTQMTTTEGIPIEISNSQKVTGIVKVYDGVGCVNKWSIAQDANGIFFVDNTNENMMWLSGSQENPIVNLSGSNAFTQFMKANNSFDVWNPKDFSNFVTFTDPAHKDVYFVKNDLCLCFSLALQSFTSFYSYERTFNMFSINNNFYSLYASYDNGLGIYNELKLYRNFTGKYNKIYNAYVDSNFTFIDHGDSFLTDKSFTNINYIQDAYDVTSTDGYLNYKDDYDNKDYYYEKDVTFNKLRVWTPFQDTGYITLSLQDENIQRKFRTWAIQISRDLKYNISNVDRIRNNWAKFKFAFAQPDYNEDGTVKQGVTNPRDIKIELMNINIQSLE